MTREEFENLPVGTKVTTIPFEDALRIQEKIEPELKNTVYGIPRPNYESGLIIEKRIEDYDTVTHYFSYPFYALAVVED